MSLQPLYIDGFYVLALYFTGFGWYGLRVKGYVQVIEIPARFPSRMDPARPRVVPHLRRFLFRGRATEF